MFKEYIYVDFLAKKNLIETIETKIMTLEKRKQELTNLNNKRYFPYGVPVVLAITSLAIWSVHYIGFPIDFRPIFVSILSSFGVLSVIAMEYDLFKDRKRKQKEEVGVSSELEFLKRQLLLERENLHQLEIEKNLEHENKELRTVEVNDKKALQELNRHERIYYDLGYNLKQYYVYYQMGRLYQKLGKYYSEEEPQLVQQYLEENQYSVARKKEL